MAKSQDAEKYSHQETSGVTHSSSTVDYEKQDHTPSSPIRSFRSSIDSIGSVIILSPLENALTVDIRSEAKQFGCPELTNTKTSASVATTGSRIPTFEVDFSADDHDDPRNWPLWRRSMIIGFVSFSTWVVVLYSTSYTSSMPGMMKEFHVKSEPVATLGVTMYLAGIACGSLVLAPLSEIYGRRPVYIGSLFYFCVMVIPTALATGLTEVIIVRFCGALAAAAMISNSPGTVADITNETYRALAFSVWSIGPMNGPVTGPIIGGFTAQYLGWRWTNWLVLILSGIAWVMCACIPETYTPIILRKKAANMRKETGDDRWWSRYDQNATIVEILKANLSRPLVLTFTEPILWFWDAYIGVIYSILYLCFVAYPLIFTGLRGWSLSFAGLAFVGIGVGTTLAIVTEPLARRLVHAHKKDPKTGRVPPEASVSIVCIASILCPIGQLWFSWTSVPITIHWIWPILAGIPFGAGNCLVFIYSSNYLAGCYGIYSASALAGNSVIRSILGGTLPLAGPAMYEKLTPQWAGTLLGIVQVVLIPIPFIFYKWGSKIRAKSSVISKMREDQEKNEIRAAKARKASERKATAAMGNLVVADEAATEDWEKKGISQTT